MQQYSFSLPGGTLNFEQIDQVEERLDEEIEKRRWVFFGESGEEECGVVSSACEGQSSIRFLLRERRERYSLRSVAKRVYTLRI
jgi:hypothetical protein